MRKARGEYPDARPKSEAEALSEGAENLDFGLLAERMVERFSALVYKIASARSQQSQDADDIFQEVFLAYSKSRPIFRDDEHAKAWFIRVSCNAANSFWRKTEHRRERPFDEGMQQDEEDLPDLYDLREMSAERELARIDLERCLDRLGTQDRQLVHLFYYEDLKSREIAGILEKQEGAVRMQLSRARRSLKECLEEGGRNS